MKCEKFINQFPLEEILPEISQREINELVKNSSYVKDVKRICKGFKEKSLRNYTVNLSDAATFFEMGYNAAVERINKVLKPI